MKLGGALQTKSVKAGLHPLEFLNLLLQDEKNYRKDRLSKSLTKRAKFRHQSDIEDLDLSYDRGLTKPKIKDLLQLQFIKQKNNLLLLGKTGAGKTHLAITLARKICASNLSVMFIPMTLMFEDACFGAFRPLNSELIRPPISVSLRPPNSEHSAHSLC